MDADVIVIGAGAAGLAAARSLAGRSFRVMVLEARDRVGGRVLSVPSPRAAVAAELGAEFVHGPAAMTRTLLRGAGSTDVDTGGESWTSGTDGELRLGDDDWIADAAAIFDQARALGEDESVEHFLRRFDGDETKREAVRAARGFVEGFEAADPAGASARAIADELRSGVDSSSARPLGGYGPMFERLRRDCAAADVQICLSTVVRRVAWQHGSVAVDVGTGWGEPRTIRARAAVVTLPVGVLRHAGGEGTVAFEPALPARKQEALANVEMGHALKVTMWFRSAFWEHLHDGRYRDAAFFRCESLPFSAYWTQVPVRSELIVAWAGGPRAIALGGRSQEELVGRALDGFGALLHAPDLARAEFENGVVHDWSRDPFARGAYSYVAVGGGDARARLGAPVAETLFFAGEATSNDGQGGTVNGALETGERAAAEVAATLGAKR